MAWLRVRLAEEQQRIVKEEQMQKGPSILRNRTQALEP